MEKNMTATIKGTDMTRQEAYDLYKILDKLTMQEQHAALMILNGMTIIASAEEGKQWGKRQKKNGG
ncbi:MAG: hypothetical protein LUC25_01075 [Ruminococcus sp.]|nr:hypothetical protein [Ruminococcus sp.]